MIDDDFLGIVNIVIFKFDIQYHSFWYDAFDMQYYFTLEHDIRYCFLNQLHNSDTYLIRKRCIKTVETKWNKSYRILWSNIYTMQQFKKPAGRVDADGNQVRPELSISS